LASYELTEIGCEHLPPELTVIHEYWEDLRGDSFAPSWREFDLMQLPASVIPDTHVFDVISPDDGLFRCRFWGTHVTDLYQQELTGNTIKNLLPENVANVAYANFKLMLDSKSPTAYQSNISTRHDRDKLMHVLRVPLSNDGTNVDQIVTSVTYLQGKRETIKVFNSMMSLAS
jgi:hypothetical protein